MRFRTESQYIHTQCVLLFPVTYPSPAQNLAADEALLELAERGEIGATLRFWESRDYFVTLGYTNRASREANLAQCGRQNVPILRRASGGGTVLQGPGSWNYGVIAPIPNAPSLDIETTNRLVMTRNRDLFRALLGQGVEICGHTDLAFQGRKFSGNAQKRKSRFFLFHGTVLLGMDLERVQSLLEPPSREPEYRGGRAHSEFIANMPLQRADVESAFCRAWQVDGELKRPLDLNALIEEKYGCEQWNLRF